MKKAIIAAKKLLRIIYAESKSKYRGIPASRAEVVLWTPNRGSMKYFISDRYVHDKGLAHALNTFNIEYFHEKSRAIGLLKDKIILLNYDRNYLSNYRLTNYAESLAFIVSQLEKSGNTVVPSSREIKFWENKEFMTREFLRLNITTPQTKLFQSKSEILAKGLSYPFLIKELHSASSKGIFKITSYADLDKTLCERFLQSNSTILVQELLDIRRDLRVIFVGDQIVHHYWRINNSDTWRPTSTSQGSTVDFGNFPEKWRAYLIEQFKRLDLRTGAFDVAWRNDNLDDTPLILEVSPSYQLNPKVEKSQYLRQYGRYKRGLQIHTQGYDVQFINQTWGVQREVVKTIMSDYLKR